MSPTTRKKKDAAATGERKTVRKTRKRRFVPADGEGPKKGFYLFPNLLTSAALFCGFWSICKTFAGDYNAAAWLIFVAMIFDGLDGKVARITRTTSAFGVQYDSLSDLVSFGVAPGLLAYGWALMHSFKRGMGWIIATMFVVCGAIRLARYNVEFNPDEKSHFKGLPIPAGAVFIAFSVLFFKHMGWVTEDNLAAYPNGVLLIVATLAFLMISTIRYYSFKEIDFLRRRPLPILLLLILLILIVVQEPQKTLYVIFLAYVLSGPIIHLWRLRHRHDGVHEEPLIE